MKRSRMLTALLGSLSLAAAVSPPPSTAGPQGDLQAALATVTAQEIEADLTFFACDDMRGRDTPSPELTIAARFLVAQVERLGFQPGADGDFLHEYRLPKGGEEAPVVENVCALWPGSDPELSKEWLIVSAHYDHVGTRGESVFNGADDNGSGSMGLLALAEALHAYGPLKRSVLLIWVSGEEKGLWGSAAWTRNPTLPAGARAVCNINIDMIGRNAPDSLLITPTRNHPSYNGLTRLAEKLGPREGFISLGNADAYWLRSDQYNFSQNLRIPVCFLFSDVHPDYHQPSDTADKIDYDKIRRVTRLVLRMLHAMQSDPLTL